MSKAATTCENCRFFVPEGAGYGYHHCRKRAPVMFPECSQWPIVHASDFCGEHEEKAGNAQ